MAPSPNHKHMKIIQQNPNDQIVSCTNVRCNKKMKRKDFKTHYNDKCPYTSQQCKRCHQQNILRKDMCKHYSKNCFLHNGRFKCMKPLSKTLQGQILLALDLHNNNKKIIIKSADRYLVSKGLSKDGHHIAEDFLTERHIIMTLTQYNDCPVQNGIVEWITSWNDTSSYYYAMKYYPVSLFDYVQYHFQEKKKHYFPSNLSWTQTVQIIFNKLCQTIQWLHSKGYCHLDLSLENAMIDPETLDITIIDLGTTKQLDNADFMYYGVIGKTHYMSPEVYCGKMYYDATIADVYSLGSMLYTMLLGARPYNGKVPTQKNLHDFALLLERYYGQLTDIISLYAIDLLKRVFRFESTRIDLESMLMHPFMTFIDDENVGNSKESRLVYADVLEMVMGNEEVGIDITNVLREKGIRRKDRFLEFVVECVEVESRNIIVPERMVNLYGMISELYVGGVVSAHRINLYFKHLMEAKYWKKLVNVSAFGSNYIKLVCCLNNNRYPETFEDKLWNECMNVFYDEKKNNFGNIIVIISELFKCNLISWNVIFNEFVSKLLYGKELFDIVSGFKLLKMMSLHKNNYNKYYKEINILINNISKNCNGKKLLIITKMIKNYWTEIDPIGMPPGLPPPGLMKNVKTNKNKYVLPPGLI